MDEPKPSPDPDPMLAEIRQEVMGTVSHPEFADKAAKQQLAIAEFGLKIRDAMDRLDPTLRAGYRRRVLDLADDLTHLLDVGQADLGELDDMRRSVVLTCFISLDDDDDDLEPEPAPPKIPGDCVPA